MERNDPAVSARLRVSARIPQGLRAIWIRSAPSAGTSRTSMTSLRICRLSAGSSWFAAWISVKRKRELSLNF